MNQPNLFDLASGEFSQDTFLCWFLSWADDLHEGTDLHLAARYLLDRLCSQFGQPLGQVSILLHRNWREYCTLIRINDFQTFLVVDGSGADVQSGWLKAMIDEAANRFEDRLILPLFLDMGNQSDHRAAMQAGFQLCMRRDMLNHLGFGIKLGVRNTVFRDYFAYLRKIEERTGSFLSKPIHHWCQDDLAWQGLFNRLQQELGTREYCWDYMSHPDGGKWGFWWDVAMDRDKTLPYLQLEEDSLCIKIWVGDPERRFAEREKWIKKLFSKQLSFGRLTLPPHPGLHKLMTVATLEDTYMASDQEGYLDLEQSLERLKEVSELVRQTVFEEYQDQVSYYPSFSRS